MQIKIMGRDQCKDHTYSKEVKPCIIISISDWGDQQPQFNSHDDIKEVLTLFFDDIILEDVEDEGYEGLFNVCLAKQIDEFVGRWAGSVEDIIVHCSFGISRSSAVAAGICLKLNQESRWIWENDRYDPNPYVFEMMKKHLS